MIFSCKECAVCSMPTLFQEFRKQLNRGMESNVDVEMENLQEQQNQSNQSIPQEMKLSAGNLSERESIEGEARNGGEHASDEDIAERIAVEALGGLKQPFLQRVQNIPLVGRTVSSISHAYESTKNSSGVLKYSAESVESLSSLISKPVLSTLEPVLGPLDRFASNQLDKVNFLLLVFLIVVHWLAGTCSSLRCCPRDHKN